MSPERELIHGIRNLLTVIETQAAVVEASEEPAAAGDAVRAIHDAARRTAELLARFERSRGDAP